MIRKAFMIAAAAALPLGMVAIAGASSSGASTPPTVANGTVNCTTVTGKIAFTPPLTTSGNSHTLTAAEALKVSGCSSTATNLPAGSIITGAASSTTTITTSDTSANSCTALAAEASKPQTLTFKWKDKNASGVTLAKLATSPVNFSGFDIVSGAGGTGGFDLPQDSGGTASIPAGGSFASTDNGHSSEGNTFTVLTESQILTACGTTKNGVTGIAKLKLGGAGTATDPSHFLIG